MGLLGVSLSYRLVFLLSRSVFLWSTRELGGGPGILHLIGLLGLSLSYRNPPLPTVTPLVFILESRGIIDYGFV